jgi:type VI secretion system secreted protein VgrG
MASQANRRVSVSSPLGGDALMFYSMTAEDQLGRLFEFKLELLSEDHDIRLEDVLGQRMVVCSELPHEGEKKYFNGFVNQISYQGSHGRYAIYSAILCPWLWFLTRTADTRIFQKKKAPDIIKDIFQENGFSDFEDRLSRSYREYEYCVQYRESDFNFVSRLMEAEGIYYYFQHDDTKHTLVLADSLGGHDKISSYEKVPYYPPDDNSIRERDCISHWSVLQTAQTGVYTLRDFDYTKPKKNLEVRSSNPCDHALSDREIYDYPGEYLEAKDGETYSRIRLEELQSQYHRIEGAGDVGGFSSGGLFALTNYPREDQNINYLLVSSRIELTSNEYESGGPSGESVCRCQFSAIDEKQPFRSLRLTPKPLVQGPQTAIVVGKSGEEIWTDKHGRVKVQFHWDREGKKDENSSCWIRVSQGWAGSNWGAVTIPRIGQEVIVDFIEGDPDQPIITGRVYNGDNRHPYELPKNATQSGIKTRSSKGGNPNNCNEIKFEDKKGEELIYIQAEKDREALVKNDSLETVKKNRKEKVGENFTVTVDDTYDLEGKEKIHIMSGSGSITMTKDGKIKISGTDVTLTAGGGKVNIDAGGIITIQGTMVKIN